MNIRTVIFLSVLLLAIASCKNSAEPPASSNLIPLKTGNQWIYETTEFDKSSNAEKISNDTVAVGSGFIRQGLAWYPITHNYIGEFISDGSDGLHRYDSASQKAILLYKYPSAPSNEYIAEHDSTNSTSGSTSIYQINIKIVSTNEQVTTPAGKFLCCHYQYDSEDTYSSGDVTDVATFFQDLYFAPNIGLVQVIEPNFSSVNPNDFYRKSVLKQYTLK